MCCLRRADKSHTLPGVQQICIRKSGEPRTAVPPEKYIAKTMEIGPCRRMQRRTYPFAFVILSPGSKIGHTPRKTRPPLWEQRQPPASTHIVAGAERPFFTSRSQPRSIIPQLPRKCKFFFGKMQNFSKNILRFAEKTLAIYGILWYHTSWLRTAGEERTFGTSHDMR